MLLGELTYFDYEGVSMTRRLLERWGILHQDEPLAEAAK